MLVDLFLATSFVLFIGTFARLPPLFSQSFALLFIYVVAKVQNFY